MGTDYSVRVWDLKTGKERHGVTVPKTVGRVVPTRTTLPVLSNVLLEASAGDGVRLVATNLELTVTAYDANGNITTNDYTGTKSLTFTGPNPAP